MNVSPIAPIALAAVVAFLEASGIAHTATTTIRSASQLLQSYVATCAATMSAR
jgi:hypothetical protein